MPQLTSEPPSSQPLVAEVLVRHRRHSRRRPLEAQVEVFQPANGSGFTINVSDGGLRIAVDCPLRIEEVVLLAVREEGKPERLECARVVWVRELRDGWIVGLQLIGLH
jgi:Tfp pilus assembly protein PilZ